MSTTSLPDGGDEDGDDRWEAVARQMLAERLEIVAMEDVRDAFIGAASRLDAGEELTQQDINDLRSALENAAHVVDLAAEASPEAGPAPDAWDYLDEDSRGEWLRDHPQYQPDEGDETTDE
jgi:hypothetical protein